MTNGVSCHLTCVHARYNISAASWLGDHTLLPDLLVINLKNAVVQMTEGILFQALAIGQAQEDVTPGLGSRAFRAFAAGEIRRQRSVGRLHHMPIRLIHERNMAPAFNDLNLLGSQHWFHKFVSGGGVLLLRKGDQEPELRFGQQLEAAPEPEPEPDPS